jgi:hypothetical protein
MVITLSDPNEETPTGRTETKWMSAINGLYSGAYDVNRVTTYINQAFTQSPYLNTK